jgi:hypothetical protein
MRNDPIVTEVRNFRNEHAKKHNNDLRKIYEDLKRSERESGKATVSYPPKLKLENAG